MAFCGNIANKLGMNRKCAFGVLVGVELLNVKSFISVVIVYLFGTGCNTVENEDNTPPPLVLLLPSWPKVTLLINTMTYLSGGKLPLLLLSLSHLFFSLQSSVDS